MWSLLRLRCGWMLDAPRCSCPAPPSARSHAQAHSRRPVLPPHSTALRMSPSVRRLLLDAPRCEYTDNDGILHMRTLALVVPQYVPTAPHSTRAPRLGLTTVRALR
ncbi:hypothetical protein GGX14DRAFT_569125 [Mycena pura]|uniref:Uncharacterized protein n=1 Tax=Mycena pura TaxID=153505 RepID=A0AAD6Y717_9AGAR|nr:hypothetical protein GGX14DRAFT_569125 [Mycena pura]